MQYRSKEGDVVDAICFQHYGRTEVLMEVYRANPKLADYGAVLPAGVLITLPEITLPAASVPRVNLFD